MEITVTEIMELADMHAYAKITESASAELPPRNLLERKIQQLFSHIAELEVKVWQCGAGANCCAQATRIEELEAQLEAVGAGGVGALLGRVALTSEGDMAAQAQHEHWTTPTTVLQRTGDALQLLCAGQRPPDAIINGWLDDSSEELQAWCCEYGPSWCQGIAVIDAAMLMVDQPTEIVMQDDSEDHEHRPAAQAQLDAVGAGGVGGVVGALVLAEAALSDIGDADREPGDDLAWCEKRAAKDLPIIRATLKSMQGKHAAPQPAAPAQPACQPPKSWNKRGQDAYRRGWEEREAAMRPAP